VVLLGLAGWHLRRAPHPLLNLRTLRVHTFRLTAAGGVALPGGVRGDPAGRWAPAARPRAPWRSGYWRLSPSARPSRRFACAGGPGTWPGGRAQRVLFGARPSLRPAFPLPARLRLTVPAPLDPCGPLPGERARVRGAHPDDVAAPPDPVTAVRAVAGRPAVRGAHRVRFSPVAPVRWWGRRARWGFTLNSPSPLGIPAVRVLCPRPGGAGTRA
jgi:hypothetical protein